MLVFILLCGAAYFVALAVAHKQILAARALGVRPADLGREHGRLLQLNPKLLK
jgi:hypothetical protein